ncbi:MAG: HEAT repeat domain-containing protein [Pirellulales bacterium]|nr:HEAT repeat domain-containing protein [Pirellulales bacterium]
MQKVVTDLKAALGDYKPDKIMTESDGIYSMGISIIFFVTCDSDLYRRETNCLLQALFQRQKPFGAWGYPKGDPNWPFGDTSMTQYGLLSCWEASQAGYNVPPEVIQKAGQWLLRTQDPSGGFGYQGKIAPEGSRVPQEKVSLSLTSAGGGCLYMVGDLLKLQRVVAKEAPVAGALHEVAVKEGPKVTAQPTALLNLSQFHEAQNMANRWIRSNFQASPGMYTHYYQYSFERYMSFREIFTRDSEKDFPWYDEIAKYLLKTQADNGSWTSLSGTTPDTAFGALFLLRSMKISLDKAKGFGSGLLVGGRGLPKDTDRAVVRGGQVVVATQLKKVEDLMELLDDPESEKLDEKVAALAELPSQQVESFLAAHGAKLRALTRGQSPAVRRAAVLALGKTRDLDNVPALIYALGDSDPEIVLEARNGLQRIRRHPTEFGPPDQFTELQRRDATEKWKAWYRSVRPEADVDF